jgi:hypothetical protein
MGRMAWDLATLQCHRWADGAGWEADSDYRLARGAPPCFEGRPSLQGLQETFVSESAGAMSRVSSESAGAMSRLGGRLGLHRRPDSTGEAGSGYVPACHVGRGGPTGWPVEHHLASRDVRVCRGNDPVRAPEAVPGRSRSRTSQTTSSTTVLIYVSNCLLTSPDSVWSRVISDDVGIRRAGCGSARHHHGERERDGVTPSPW